jgi:hypothetical protein
LQPSPAKPRSIALASRTTSLPLAKANHRRAARGDGTIYGLFYNAAFSPFPISAQRVAADRDGQKTGAGWFRYENGKKIEPDVVAAPTARPSRFGRTEVPSTPSCKRR